MLTEIICNRFRKNKISFSEGLNVVVGDGSNSIGKSTLLLVIDFIFGGSDFIEKNKIAIQHIGEHEYNFSFTFDKKYYFKRGTKYPNDIYICDENYNIQRTIRLNEYKEFLKCQYIPDLTDLSFREFIGTFSRIWGKGNDEITFELKPLQIHPSDSVADCLTRLVKIFNQYGTLKSLIADKEGKETRLKAVKKLFGTDFLPPSIKKGQYDKNKEKINEITDEVQNIKEDLAAFSVSIRDVIDREIIKLKKEKDSLLNYKFELNNRRNNLQNSLTSDRRFKTKGIAELQEILPNIDTDRLAQVEAFHNDIFNILSTEVRILLKKVNEELEEVNSRINQINSEITLKLKSADMPTVLVDRVYSLATDYSKLKSENDLYEKEHNLSEAVNNLKKDIDATMTEKLSAITSKVNAEIYKLCHEIYGDNYKSPVFKATSQKYSYENRDNTGAGATSFSLILFDITILRLTELPVLIHDSRLYNSLESRAIENLLSYYNISQKQSFIAFDDIDKLSLDAQNFIKENEVISLNSTFTLYDIDWKESN